MVRCPPSLYSLNCSAIVIAAGHGFHGYFRGVANGISWSMRCSAILHEPSLFLPRVERKYPESIGVIVPWIPSVLSGQPSAGFSAPTTV